MANEPKIDLLELRSGLNGLLWAAYSYVATAFSEGWYWDLPDDTPHLKWHSLNTSHYVESRKADTAVQSVPTRDFINAPCVDWATFTEYAKDISIRKRPIVRDSSANDYVLASTSQAGDGPISFHQDIILAPANLLPRNKAIIQRYIRFLNYHLTKSGLCEWNVALEECGRVNGRGGMGLILVSYDSSRQPGFRPSDAASEILPQDVMKCRIPSETIHAKRATKPITLPTSTLLHAAPLLTAKYSRQMRTAFDRLLEIGQCCRLL